MEFSLADDVATLIAKEGGADGDDDDSDTGSIMSRQACISLFACQNFRYGPAGRESIFWRGLPCNA